MQLFSMHIRFGVLSSHAVGKEIIEHVNLLFCSADKSRLKRKLDMDPEFGYAE